MDLANLAQTLAPLTATPARSGVLLDVDGTLAPIVANAHEATVPQATRDALAAVAERYGLVACVTGRQAMIARAMVGLESITYFGNHGSELLPAGGDEAVVAPDAAEWTDRVKAFSRRAWEDFELEGAGVRPEDKGAIQGFHWRGAPDEAAAEAMVRRVAHAAQEEGLGIHWAKKILEVRPAVEFSKGSAVGHLLGEADLDAAMFCGDDVTDLHAFEELDEAVARGHLRHAFKIGVDSPEAPPGLAPASDILLAGTEEMRALLELLAA
ncbi:MAG TPA: trehalose-phosphatase [Baekduia sp.]|nr:trehalose-phosphatase [Baekduia sp.]